MKQTILMLCLSFIFACKGTDSENNDNAKLNNDIVNGIPENVDSRSETPEPDQNATLNDLEDCNLSLDEKVAFIKDKFQRINAEKNYTTKIISDEDEYSSEDATFFYKNSDLNKISYTLGGDAEIQNTEYYIWNNKLIFVYFKRDYNNGPENRFTQEQRVYYCNEKPIKYISDKDVMNSVETQNTGNGYFNAYSDLIKQINE
jgi:hypothetical protein